MNKWEGNEINMDNLLEEFGCEGVDGEGFDSEVFCFVCACFYWF